MTINIQTIKDHYSVVRSMKRMTIGYIVIGTIVASICFDIWYQHVSQPLSYTAKTAHAEEVKEEPKEAQIRVQINWTRERMEKEVDAKAKEYGVSAQLMRDIIKCESNWDADIQSNHILSYGREKSFGLVQIHLPSHPNVSYEEAIDPAFAIDFLASHIADGSARMWTCYKMVR